MDGGGHEESVDLWGDIVLLVARMGMGERKNVWMRLRCGGGAEESLMMMMKVNWVFGAD